MKQKKVLSMITAGFIAATMAIGQYGWVAAEELEAEGAVEDIVEIDFYNMDLAGGTDFSRIEDAVNEISEEEIGVHVNIYALDFGSYLQQVSLNLSGNEPMDLILYTPAAPLTFANMTSQNQLLDISDLLEEYGEGILEDLGGFLKGTQYDDGVYGVTSHSEFATNMYIIMRKDILEELDLVEKAENMSSWTEFEEILQAVYEANQSGELPEELQTTACISNSENSGKVIPNQTSMCGSDNFDDCYGFDGLGDNFGIIATDPETDTVSEYYLSDDYYQCLQRVNSWYEKGYVYKDAALTESDATTLMQNGVTFSFIALGNYGIEENQRKSTGYEVISKKVLSIPMGSNVCQTWGLGLPITCDDPEAAVSFINLMYTNSDVMNILTWGIEGEDYEVNEEGEAVRLEGASYSGFSFLWGNASLSYPTEGQGGDFYDRAKEEDDNAEISKYMGFVPNTEEFANELTAVNTVLSKYKSILESGTTSDLDGDYQSFLSELESAGIQTVIDGYQEQLNAWLGE
jgi:putative aldouronate transport system substrate-binding protein